LGILAFSGCVYSIYFLLGFFAESKIHFFFNASNPTIKNGGFIMESKKAIYNLIPQYYQNGTYKEGTTVVEIKAIIEQSNIRYPLIAKPDVGLRGSGVKKINTLEDLEQYALRQILIL
jgi:hypothetical protein